MGRPPPWVLLQGDAALWAVPARHAIGIRPAQVIPLPTPRDGIAGLFPDADRSIPISTVVAASGTAVLLVEHEVDGADLIRAALLVRSVVAVQPLPAPGPAPQGQQTALVSGTSRWQDDDVLILDLALLLTEMIP